MPAPRSRSEIAVECTGRESARRRSVRQALPVRWNRHSDQGCGAHRNAQPAARKLSGSPCRVSGLRMTVEADRLRRTRHATLRGLRLRSCFVPGASGLKQAYFSTTTPNHKASCCNATLWHLRAASAFMQRGEPVPCDPPERYLDRRDVRIKVLHKTTAGSPAWVGSRSRSLGPVVKR